MKGIDVEHARLKILHHELRARQEHFYKDSKEMNGCFDCHIMYRIWVKRVGQVHLVTDHQRKKNVLLYTYVYVLLRNKDIE